MCAWKGTRPPNVVERDAAVLTLLTESGPLSRNDIADRLGYSKTLTYLSLDRLRSANPPKAKRCLSEKSRDDLWSAAVSEPCT